MAVAVLVAALLAAVRPGAGFLPPTLPRPSGLPSQQAISHQHTPRAARCSQSRRASAASEQGEDEGESWMPSQAQRIPEDPNELKVGGGGGSCRRSPWRAM